MMAYFLLRRSGTMEKCINHKQVPQNMKAKVYNVSEGMELA